MTWAQSVSQSATWQRNDSLNSLPDPVRNLLLPHLQDTVFPQESILWEPGRKIDRVYFPYRGAVSLIAQTADGSTIGLAMIGPDGVIGGLAALGLQNVFARCVVNVELGALCIATSRLQEILLLPHAANLKSLLLADVDRLLFQMQQVSACNALHPIETRLARLLLRTADCVGSDNGIPFTQEQISQLLGVQRTTINLVIRIMANVGLLRSRRGRVEIVDRSGLEKKACECYASISSRLDRGLAPPPDYFRHG